MSTPQSHTHNEVKSTSARNIFQAHTIVLAVGDRMSTLFNDHSLLDALTGASGPADAAMWARRGAEVADGLAKLAEKFPDQLEAALDAPETILREPPAAGLSPEVIAVIRTAVQLVDQRVARHTAAADKQSARIDKHLVALKEISRTLLRVVAESGAAAPKAAVVAHSVSTTSPYPGMKAFTSEQGELFFGRGELTARLLRRLAEQPAHGLPLLVIGVSGAGKSSLLRAGLVPALSDGELSAPGSKDWPCGVVQPGDQPLRELVTLVAGWAGMGLGQALDDVRADPERFALLVRQAVRVRTGENEPDAPSRAVLIVDQFEEIFLQCKDPDERGAFLAALRAAGRAVDGDSSTPAALVVLGVRADAYAPCADTPLLADALRHNQFLVGPMSVAELRQAIEEPAAWAGLTLDDGLAQQMIDDLGAVDSVVGSYQPGALPLLAFALEATWESGRLDGTLTLAGYRRTGGVNGSVALAADDVFARLSEPEQRVLRRLLLSLVAVGEDMQNSRRRVPRQVLVGDDAVAARVLDELIKARLVTITKHEQRVEIIHEALLKGWPLLTEWLRADRAAILVRNELVGRARIWLEQGRDQDTLYRGAQLAGARVWLRDADGRFDLGPGEREFIAASIDAEERRHADERRQVRRFKRMATGVGILLVLALVAGAIAVAQWRRADISRAEAVSRQYAAESIAAAAASPRRAMMLALLAYRAAPTAEARSVLLSAGMSGYAGAVGGEGGHDVAVSPDGSLIAIVGVTGQVEVWRTDDHRRLEIDLSGNGQRVTTLGFSPDGRMLATATVGLEGVTVWEMPSGRAVTRLAGSAAVAWSPDGQRLVAVAAARDSGWLLRFWRTDTWQETGEIPSPDADPFRIAYSPAGDLIAVGGGTGGIAVSYADGRLAWRQPGKVGSAVVVAWSPDGRTVASGGTSDDRVRFWEAVTGTPAGETAVGDSPRAGIAALSYSPDGEQVVIADGGPLRVWDVRRRAWLSDSFGAASAIRAVGRSRDGRMMAVVPASGPTALWRWDPRWLSWPDAAARSVGFSQDSATVVAGGTSGSLTAWDTATHSPQWTIQQPQPVVSVSVGPTGLTASGSGDAVLVSGPAGERVAAPRLDGFAIQGAVFTPDNELLVVAADKAELGAARPSSLTTWSTRSWQRRSTAEFAVAGRLSAPIVTPDGARVIVVETAPVRTDALALRSSVHVLGTGDLIEQRAIDTGPDQVLDAAVSPDGRNLATVGQDRHVSLWDLRTGKPISRFGPHPGLVRTVAFAPDGSQVATGSADSVVRLWSVPGKALIATLTGHTGELNEIAWAGDGTLATASTDGRIGLWDLDPNRVITRLCHTISGPETANEWRALSTAPTDAPCH